MHPLENFLKLIAKVLQTTPVESVKKSESPATESVQLLTTVENTETTLSKTLEERFMINVSILQDELQNFVSSSAEVQGAILASPDGLALASVLPVGMDEERTAAMSASMLSLGERIGRELARGIVDRIVVEGEKGYGVLVACGTEAVLLVLASAAVKQGILFLEIKRIVSRIAPLLA
jgi:predicted regulator of Ras-like GTPase activity (Roadblock/LC7/MglB family)